MRRKFHSHCGGDASFFLIQQSQKARWKQNKKLRCMYNSFQASCPEKTAHSHHADSTWLPADSFLAGKFSPNSTKVAGLGGGNIPMHAKRLLVGITIQIPGGHSSHLHFYSCYAQNKADLPVSLTKSSICCFSDPLHRKAEFAEGNNQLICLRLRKILRSLGNNQ